MKNLKGTDLKKVKYYLEVATKEARKATCSRAQCGAVIVNSDVIVGVGHNSPPLDNNVSRMCNNQYTYSKKTKLKYDTTCCVHAEWRALTDTLKNNSSKLAGSTLYFMRIEDDNPIKTQPFCTVCSRLQLDLGVKETVLWQDEGYISYDSLSYNQTSYAYFL